MSKQRWQPSDKPGGQLPPQRSAGSAKRLARWREKGEGPRGPARSNVRIFAGLFSLAMVLALIVAAILVLRPMPKPQLVLLSAEYRVPLIEPNAFAQADAASLAGESQVFDLRVADDDSLNFVEMTALVNQLSELSPRGSWFGTEPTTALVYVNAMGVAVWDETAHKAVPYILPNDFEIPTKLEGGGLMQAIKIYDLIDKLTRSKANRKILVLDCQRVNSIWPLGVLTNQFVESVRDEINTFKPEDRRGLYVLASCSPGEVTWVDRSVGHSSFARYFIEAFHGSADKEGNKDGYVSLAELEAYLSRHVRNWSRHRADVQTPTLIGKDDSTAAEDVRIVALPWGVAPPVFKPAPVDAAFIDKLRAGWKDYYTLGQESPPPWRYAPQHWRLFEETLLRAEDFYRAGDVAAANQELSAIARRLSDIKGANPAQIAGDGFSLPMDRFLDANTSSGNDSSKELASSFQTLIDRLLSGNESFESFAKNAKSAPLLDRTPPVEIQLALQLSALPSIEDRAADARAQIQRRLLAEDAAVAESLWAPEVTSWLRPHLDEADLGRRFLEDKFFAAKGSVIPVESQSGAISERLVDDLYHRVKDRAAILAQAMALREQVLAELPHINRLATRRPWGAAWQKSDEPFRVEAYQSIDKIVRGIAALNRQLSGDRLNSGKSRDKIDEDIVAISQTAGDLSKSHAALLELVAAESRQLGKSSAPSQTEIMWRRVNEITLVPFPTNPGNPAESARTRVNLIARICEPVLQAGEGAPSTSGQTVGNIDEIKIADRRERVLRVAKLAQELFSVGVDLSAPAQQSDLGSVQNPTQLGGYVGGWWRQIRELAVADKVDPNRRDQLFQADTARRLLEGYVSPTEGANPSSLLRRLNVADFLAWQSTRMAEDFWAASPGQTRHYFDIASQSYLERARSLHSAQESSYISVGDRIRELVRLAGEIRLDSDRSNVRFTVQDEELVSITPTLPHPLPAGIAGLFAEMTPATVPFRQESPGKFLIGKGESAEGTANFTTLLNFRGHRATAPVIVNLADAENGPTVIYENRLPANGTYSLRVADSDKSDLKLLFVLDCSRSMRSSAGKSGQSRIEGLRSVLTQFAKETPENAIDVGVRWFGSRAKDNELALGLEDTTKKLNIEPFSPISFRDNIPDAERDLGSYTPLIHSLIKAKDDFASVPEGNRQIVLISDGMDSKLDSKIGDVKKKVADPATRDRQVNDLVKHAAGEIIAAYRDSGIKINTIGFFFEGEASILKEIAEGTGGQYISIDESPNQLLAELTRIANLLRYSAINKSNGIAIPDPPAKLQTAATEYSIPPGFHDVRITDPQGKPATDFTIRVRPGDLHELIYSGRQIHYVDDLVEGGKTAKGPVVRILRSSPAGKNVELEFALFKLDDHLWEPSSLHVTVTPDGSDRKYIFHQLSPNLGGKRFPAWRLVLEDWPSDSRKGSIDVSWAESPTPIDVDPNQPGSGDKIQTGISMGRPKYLDPPPDLKAGTKVSLKLSFDDAVRGDMSEWAIVPEGKIRWARQVYDTTSGIYTGYFVIEGVSRLSRISVYPPSKPTDTTIVKNTKFTISTPSVNLTPISKP